MQVEAVEIRVASVSHDIPPLVERHAETV
jgi:hypothetical protein